MGDKNKYHDVLLTYYEYFIKNSNQIVFILDNNLNILAYNDSCLEIWKFYNKNFENTLHNLNFINDFFSTYHLKNSIADLYKQVIISKKSLKFIGINFNRVPQYAVLIIKINPILDPDTNEVISLICESSKPDFPILWYKFPKSASRVTADLKKKRHCNSSLSDIDKEILFLIFQFDTIEEIASILSIVHNKPISYNSVSKTIRRRLYEIFNVRDHKSLKVKAAEQNFHKIIPETLMPEVLIKLDDL